MNDFKNVMVLYPTDVEYVNVVMRSFNAKLTAIGYVFLSDIYVAFGEALTANIVGQGWIRDEDTNTIDVRYRTDEDGKVTRITFTSEWIVDKLEKMRS